MSETEWQRLVRDAAPDDDVLGLVLTGGRGKGVSTPASDWDAVLVVADHATDRWRRRPASGLDLTVLGATEFERYADPGTPFFWRAYDLVALWPAVDRGGFGARLERKGRLSPEVAATMADGEVDAALNQLYRATKNRRDGNDLACVLDLAEFPAPYLTAVFALEGRHRPYHKFLEWELRRQPLRLLSLPRDVLLSMLLQVVRGGEVEAAWLLVDGLGDACRAAGVTTRLTAGPTISSACGRSGATDPAVIATTGRVGRSRVLRRACRRPGERPAPATS